MAGKDSERLKKQLDTVQAELIEMVQSYYAQYRQAIPIKALSTRYRVKLRMLRTDFVSFISSLESQKLIAVRFKENGSRVVYPGLSAWK